MKKFTLKVVTMDLESTGTKEPVLLDYRTAIMGLLKNPANAEKGATYEELATSMPIWIKFRDAKKVVYLEDAEHEFTVQCLKNSRFVTRTVELLDMINSVIDAPVEAPTKRK